jgi:peptidyl-prolyl isomerase E (cyclophilin E)
MSTSTSSRSDPTILASKRALYVGGLADDVTPTMLRAAFIPFGNIKIIDMPMDYKVGKHRHFAFVEFEDADDASEAIFNMDGSDLIGKTMRVSLAQQNQLHKLLSAAAGGSAGGSATDAGSSTTSGPTKRNQAIWSSDEWFQQHVVGSGAEDEQKRKETQQDVQTLVD